MIINAIDKWGTTIDEAVSLALADLNCSRDDVEVTVLEEPSKGFLGFGAKLAKVHVERKKAKAYEKITQPEKKPEPAKRQYGPIGKEEVTEEEKRIDRTAAPSGKKENGRNRKNRKDNRKSDETKKAAEPKEPKAPKEAVELPDEYFTADIHKKPENLVPCDDTPALGFLTMLTEKMGLDVEVRGYKNDECVYMDISGKDAGTLIGKRGATLDSIQYLTSLVVNKETDGYTKVIVDVENYREKREKTLTQLANRLAGKVLQSGKSVRLEPMNPYERKVIHATLQKYPGVNTRSEGEEPYRRVIIERERKGKADKKAANSPKAPAAVETTPEAPAENEE